MLLVSLVSWWYSLGWRDQVDRVRRQLDRTADFFSLELVLRTLFHPFRQIDAQGAKGAPIAVALRAMFDQLFSRLFGAVIRCFLIVIGSVAIALVSLAGVVRIAAWPLIPALPLVAVVFSGMGWTPWR